MTNNLLHSEVMEAAGIGPPFSVMGFGQETGTFCFFLYGENQNVPDLPDLPMAYAAKEIYSDPVRS